VNVEKNDAEQNVEERRDGSKKELMPCSNMIPPPSPTPFLFLSFFPILQSTLLGIHFILKSKMKKGNDLIFVFVNIMGLRAIYVCNNTLKVLQL